MKDVSTEDLLNRLVLTARQAERARCIVQISPTGANAAKLRGADRAHRAACTALEKHLKQCIGYVKRRTKK